MANITTSFDSLEQIDAALQIFSGAYGVEAGLNWGQSAFDWAYYSTPSAYTYTSDSQVSVSYSNGNTATLYGSGLLGSTPYMTKLDFNFGGYGTRVILNGSVSESYSGSLTGNINKVTVSSGQYGTIILNGSARVDGTGGTLSSFSVNKNGAAIEEYGTFSASIWDSGSAYQSSYQGVVNSGRLNYGGNELYVTNMSVDAHAPSATAGQLLETISYGNDVIRTSGDSALLMGYGGDDKLYGGAGNDVIDGGSGTDYAIYSSARSNYTVTATSQGYSIAGPEGTDSLTSVEYVTFSDQTVLTSSLVTSTNKGGTDDSNPYLVYVFKSEKIGPGINQASYSYLYTTDAGAASYIQSQAAWPWVQKTSTFEAAHSNPANFVPVYRFWSEINQSHYFAVGDAARDWLINRSAAPGDAWDWAYEQKAFDVYTSSKPTDASGKSAIPVYEVWMDDKDFNSANGYQGGHFWTADYAEYQSMLKLVGVHGDGIAFYGEAVG